LGAPSATLAAVTKISQGELAAATDDHGEKLYGGRIAAVDARTAELK
jgi:hypothetical protein